MRKISPALRAPPKSYFLPGVTLSENLSFPAGGFVNVWRGHQDGNQVCVKAFRAHSVTNLDEVRQVCGSSIL